MIDAGAQLADLALARPCDDGAPVFVGIAGSVAVGKSTLAAAVAAAITGAGRSVQVMTTDDFLYPNAELAQRLLLWQKGFPESYDVNALRAFVKAMRGGNETATVPVYSHETYDIVADERRTVRSSDVIVIEGVNTLSALGGSLDLAVYVDADERDVESWFLDRFHRWCDDARDDPRSFYRVFVGMDVDAVDQIARQTWRDINLVNLRQHIAPSRSHADAVVHKGADHRVTGVEVR